MKTLKKYNKKVWIMLNIENSDHFFKNNITQDLSTYTICIITQNDTYMIINKLDENNCNINIKKENLYIFDGSSSLRQILESIFSKIGFLDKISLSYSTFMDVNTDILTHGKYVFLTKLIRKIYSKNNKVVKFDSAEDVMYDILSKKSDLELKRLKLLAKITNEILDETFDNIKIGYTEIEISSLTIKYMKDIMKKYIGTYDIVDFDVAWENAPIVLTGKNLSNGGHSVPSNKKFCIGETIYFDFGIKVTFNDNTILYTDMQRMGYATKQNGSIPQEVEKVFSTLKNSIKLGMEKMKPGVKGYVIDEIVRGKIKEAGYVDYPHATGHPVGRNVHDIGAVISIKGSKRANMKLVENGVYTLEPRVNIKNGGSIEEMIQVTKDGGIPLAKVQEKLYIIKESR